MNPTTVHSSEVVGQLVLIETDAIRARVKHAIAGWSESEGKARSTIGRRLSTICGFYKYCSQERLIERDR